MITTPDQQFAVPDATVFRTPEREQLLPQEHMSVGQDSPHSTESNRSAKPEHHTASFANQFLRATYFSLEKYLEEKAWFKYPSRLGLLYVSAKYMLANSHTERNKRWASELESQT